MSRAVLGVWLFALLGCAGANSAHGASEAARSASAAASHAADEVLALLAELPVGADRCVLAQPSRVDTEHRALTQRVSQAEPFAWLPELELRAYASVERAGRDGPSARVSLLSFAVAPDKARALLEAHGGVALDFEASSAASPPCSGVGCPVRARFTGPHRLRLERGEFGVATQPGIEWLCRKLVEQKPGSLETSAARGGPAAELDLSGLPLRTSAELTVMHDGVRVLRIDWLPSALEADAALQDEAAAGIMLGPLLAVGSNLRRERRGAALYSEYDVLWQDLEFARDDDARAQVAEREAETLVRALPGRNLLPARREDVLGQLGYLLDQARRSAEPERSSELLAARTLLEQALSRAPDDEGIALLLCELLLLELHDAEPAAQIAQRFASHPLVSARFAVFGRNAAALISADALASRLLADGMAKARDAATLAREILSRMQQGAPYELAEHAALDARK